MNEIKLNKILECIFLLLISALLLYTGLALVWDYKIEHPYPWGYYATDAFQHQTRAQWIKDSENYRFEAPYYSSNLKDIVGFYPPILNHAAVFLSDVSGFQVYDTIQLIIFLAAIFGALTMYLIIKEFNPRVALLSMPFVLFLFALQSSRVGWFWGHWPSLIGNLFLIMFLWSMLKISKIKKSYILIALFLAGTIMSHSVFAIYSIIFIVSYALFQKEKINYTKNIAFACLICLFLTGYYLNIFAQSWLKIQPYKFSIVYDVSGFGGALNLTDFGYLFYILLFGMFLCVLLLRKKENASIISLFVLLMGFTNLIGFERRAFNLRFFWPITLSLFFGVALYFIINKSFVYLKKEMSYKQFVALSIIIAIIVFYSLSANYIDSENAGIMNSQLWDTATWISKNTPENSSVIYFYSELYDQFAFVGNSKRTAIRVQTQDFLYSMQNNTINKFYKAWTLSEYGAGLPYKKGFLSYGLKSRENPALTSDVDTDICSADYFVLSKYSAYPKVADYSMVIAQRFLNHSMEVVHQNDLNLIIKNNNAGKECVN